MRYFTIFMDNWFMHLLFLVSGVGAALSLKKRTAGRFMAERANRLLLPLLVGTLLFISVQSWLRALSFGTFPGASSPSIPISSMAASRDRGVGAISITGTCGFCYTCSFFPPWRCPSSSS